MKHIPSLCRWSGDQTVAYAGAPVDFLVNGNTYSGEKNLELETGTLSPVGDLGSIYYFLLCKNSICHQV